MSSPAKDDKDTSKALSRVREMLGHRLCITLTDGRRIEGIFECMDDSRNLIVAETKEWREDDRGGKARWIGRVMVPATAQVQIMVDDASVQAKKDRGKVVELGEVKEGEKTVGAKEEDVPEVAPLASAVDKVGIV